jgi:hypothetical protein
VLHAHAGINCVTDSPTVKVLTSYNAAIIIMVVFTCIVVVLITAYTRWHLELCLFWKDRFGKLEDGNINTHMFGYKTPSAVYLYTKFMTLKHIREVVSVCMSYL